MPERRVSARLGRWTPPTKYNQPQLEPSGDIRTTEHEVLADRTVVQYLGDNPDNFTLRGDCYADDLAVLRSLKGDEVQLRHEIYSGPVLVTSVNGSPTSSWDNVDGERRWVYNYTVDMLEVK